jgi:hypothetical protein
MARRWRDTSPETAAHFERKAAGVSRHAEAIRETIATLGPAPSPERSEPAA